MPRLTSILAIGTILTSVAFAQSSPRATTVAPARISFEQNQGQVDSQVKYLFHGNRSALFLTGNGAVISYRSDDATVNSVRMSFVGSASNAPMQAEDEQPGKVNYLLGSDPSQWHTNLPTFAKVRYRNLYPGVDAVFYGKEGDLEYDLIVAPGASAKNIALQFDQDARIDNNGDLVL